MLKKKSILPTEITRLIAKLAGEELYAHHLYLHIASQLQARGLFGGMAFFESESDAELGHFKKLRDFVNDCGGVLPTPSVMALTEEVKDLEDALDLYYEAELNLLNKYLAAYKESDKNEFCLTEPLFLKFIDIQRKSVGEAGDLLATYAIAKENKEVLLFDAKLKP
jgi:ferritin